MNVLFGGGFVYGAGGWEGEGARGSHEVVPVVEGGVGVAVGPRVALQVEAAALELRARARGGAAPPGHLQGRHLGESPGRGRALGGRGEVRQLTPRRPVPPALLRQRRLELRFGDLRGVERDRRARERSAQRASSPPRCTAPRRATRPARNARLFVSAVGVREALGVVRDTNVVGFVVVGRPRQPSPKPRMA